MADENNNSRMRLGRGLAALLGDVGSEMQAEHRNRAQRRVPIEFLRPNPLNPRRNFPEVELEELAASIRERDIIQPIIVRGVTGIADAFEIIAGERRWRAAQRAGLHDVPVVIVEADDRQALEFAIIENIQRADLNPIDEARGYENLIAQFAYTQGDLAKVMGKSCSHVANTLRLARLPETVKEKVVAGALSAGHARALLAVADPEMVARRIIDQGLTVRDVEKIGQREAEGSDQPAGPRKAVVRDA
ncbi:MAG TPA: ParB/RepB/Spo0J family partition protein, partial [Rhabdaerophilum sp.]|nr:ParB/RepB/Spo0J family partition protein [Rhabdaerophilum sp.]